MTRAILTSVCCSLLFLASCCKKELGPGEFVAWVEDEGNGYKKMKKLDDLEFEIQFKPHEYIALKESGKKILDRAQLASEMDELGEMQYITLRIRTANNTDPLQYKIASKDEYFNRLKYFSFDVQADVRMVEGNDTVECSLAHYERSFGMAPETTILLGFQSKQNVEGDKIFIYNDRIFNSGPVIMNLSEDDMMKLPKIKI